MREREYKDPKKEKLDWDLVVNKSPRKDFQSLAIIQRYSMCSYLPFFTSPIVKQVFHLYLIEALKVREGFLWFNSWIWNLLKLLE